MNRDADLAAKFPNASASFLAANRLVVARIPDAQPEPTPRKEPLDTHQAQESGKGRTLVCFERRGTRLLDSDNAHGGIKPCLDALRYAGYIPDDDPASIVLVVRQRKVKKAQTGTFILISPIPCQS